MTEIGLLKALVKTMSPCGGCRLRKHHVHERGGDANQGEAAHEARLRLEQIDAPGAIDHRRIVLMAVENADDIVAAENRSKAVRGFAPPVRRPAAGIGEVTAGGSQRSTEKLSQP